MDLPSLEHVRSRLNYDPKTGVFTWKTNRIAARIGRETGATKDGYRQIRIMGRLYRAHRLAWLLMTGSWPDHDIDHRNLDRGDNRWSNLRAANKRENACNTGIRADNKSGFKGVSWDRDLGKWRADIKLMGRRKYLGSFDDPEHAHRRYVVAVEKHFGQFGRVS